MILLVGLSFAKLGWAQEVETCTRCGWRPPRTAATTTVLTADELRLAVKRAKPESTILIEDGVYHLGDSMLEIRVRGLVLRGRKGQRSRVLVRGRGMSQEMVAISISASNVTVADLTISQVGHHGIQVRGENGGTYVTIHHVHIVDTGQQLIKGTGPPGTQPTRGLVACSTLEYTDTAPSDYTNGIDVLNGEHWVVRIDNVLRRIRGPKARGLSRTRTGHPVLGGLARYARRAQLAGRLPPWDRAGFDGEARHRT